MLTLFENDWIFLSETFAWNYRIPIKVGSEIELNTKYGPKVFKVAGIFSDFFIGGGRVVIHQNTFQKYWDDSLVTNLQIFFLLLLKECLVLPAKWHHAIFHVF